MDDLDRLRRLAVTLPEVVETGPGHYDVGGKGMVWTWKERIHPKRARVARLDVVAFRTVDIEDKHALIETYPAACFTEPHYANYPAVLARLPEADDDILAELLLGAWLAQAPRRLVAGFDPDAWPPASPPTP